MARPLQKGLGYFPLDTNFDDTIELLEAKFGLEGFAIFIKLLQKIYSNNYYLDWNEEIKLLFVKRHNLNINLVNEILNYCLEKNIFNNNLFSKFSILTSAGIQSRYFKAIERRKNIEIINAYILIDLKDINATLKEINVDINSSNVDINSQSKVKNSIVYNIKEEKTDFDINILPEMQDINNKAEVEVKSVFDIYNMQAEIFPDKLRKSIDYTDKARQNLKTLIIDNKFNRQLFFQKLNTGGIDKWKNAPVDFNFWFNNTDFYIKLINGTYDNNNFQKQNNSEETAEKQYPYIDPANYDIKYVFDNGCNGYKFLEITTDKAGNKVMLIFDAKHKRNIIGKVIKENEKEEWKKFEMMMMNKEVKKDKGGKAAYYYV